MFNQYWPANILTPIMCGATLHFLNPVELGFRKAAELINDFKITVSQVFTSGHREIIATVSEEQVFPHVRLIWTSGEPLF